MSDFEDLSARERRGELSRAEQQRLKSLLNGSVEARLWHQAGKQLDADGAISRGDHDAAERVMQRTLAALQKPPLRRKPRWLPLLAAATFFVVSAAAAGILGVRYFRAATSRHEAVVAPARKAVPVLPVAPMPEPRVVEPIPSAVPSVSVNTPKPRAEAPVDAAALLRAAGLARREGDSLKAIALLDALQTRFPGSREARASDMTLGTLQLQRGSAALALEHFRRYLRAAPGGALAPEALWGETRALKALGREAEAERRLDTLVERFPSSPYAAARRAR
jgi:TolA-binding protein